MRLSVRCALQTERFVGLILLVWKIKELKVCEISVPLRSTTQPKRRNRQRAVCPVITSPCWGESSLQLNCSNIFCCYTAVNYIILYGAQTSVCVTNYTDELHSCSYAQTVNSDRFLERLFCTHSFTSLLRFGSLNALLTLQGSQNFKIPGSPSGRYSSDFGSPKISLTSPNKKKDHKCQSKTFSIHKYQGKSFILLFTGNVPSNFVSCWAKLFSIGRTFRAPEQKHSLYQTCTAHSRTHKKSVKL